MVQTARNERPGSSALPDSAFAAQVLTEEPELKSWSQDTCARYLGIAARLNQPGIQAELVHFIFCIRAIWYVTPWRTPQLLPDKHEIRRGVRRSY